MKATTIEIEERIEKLLTVLDRDIQYIKETLSSLDELRILVIKRDDMALGKLLEGIQGEENKYKSNGLKRRLIQEELAAAFNCSFKQMTLSQLEAELTGEKKAEVSEKKTELQTLTNKLKKEHLKTAMLLSDCARFNSLLLRGVFGFKDTETVTYNFKGTAKRQKEMAFINLQF